MSTDESLAMTQFENQEFCITRNIPLLAEEGNVLSHKSENSTDHLPHPLVDAGAMMELFWPEFKVYQYLEEAR